MPDALDERRCAWEKSHWAWTEAAAASARGEPVTDGDVLALYAVAQLAWSEYVREMRRPREEVGHADR